MGPLGELGALFNPGMRHEIEERKSKANRREEEGNARDGDVRIDLASGVAVINMAKSGGRPAGDAGVASGQTDMSSVPIDESEGGSKGAAEPGPAPEKSERAETAIDAQSAGTDRTATRTPVTGTATAAQARRIAAAARRSASAAERPARPATAHPGTSQVPSSKASRAAR